ncbi:MAG: tRNA pseudouridine(38-40) synthase TruA [Archaeoglobales archaeon]|nr:tRNA pseudouridine(38-40) synthase TruA [Archaeoglobales archaeon]
MRLAVKLAYFGDKFHGSQYQPNVRTVEGELLKALERFGIKNPNLRLAGRTDAGVHAYGQVAAFDCNDLITPRMLNSELPEDITVWGWKKVDENFDPRKAKSRTYIYVIYAEDLDIKAIRDALKFLYGTHDFLNFTKKFGEGESCVRTILKADVRAEKDFLIFEIEGDSFTWNMIRCIVTALIEVGTHRRDINWFKTLLCPEKHRERIEPAPPYGLILKEVKYENLEFEIDDYAFKTLQNRIEERIRVSGVIYKLFSQFKKCGAFEPH